MAGPADRFSRAQAYAIWMLWLSYGSFYFCRSNSSVFAVGLHDDPAIHLSNGEIGLVLGCMKLAYGLGQLINGQLAERFAPRTLLAIGMLGSAALNVLFGLGTGLYFYLFVWAANGYFQALGWAPTMRAAARWFPTGQRGRAVGIIGTGYSVTGVVTWVVAGFAAERFGWRGALYLPAALLTAVAIYLLVALRDAPSAGPATASRAAVHAPWHVTLRLTIGNRRLWVLALALALIDASRYGFSDWGIKHLMEVQHGKIGEVALQYSMLPIAGAVGAISAGWISDRIFDGRRIPAIATYAALLALAGLAYGAAVEGSLVLSVATLALVGFALAGAQTLLVGSAPMDLARGGTPAAAVGFVNMWGYLGAFSQDQLTPRLVRVPLFSHPVFAGAGTVSPDWHRAVFFWSACAAAAALVVLPLWRARSDDA